MKKKNVVILGSTGYVGKSVIDVIRRFPDRFNVIGIAACKNVNEISRQIDEFSPEMIAVYDENAAKSLKSKTKANVVSGSSGLIEIATMEHCDILVSAVVGAVGLLPVYHAVQGSVSRIAIANKETLVMAGSIIMDLARKNNVEIIPIDSEHSAIFQCLGVSGRKNLAKIILTGSGGPFRNYSAAELTSVTPASALAHPVWKMGNKISIDSATLMNKGLEVIEAGCLFGIDVHDVEVVIHPQCVIHSMVEYSDGSIIAQLAVSDMRGPILYALSHPERFECDFLRLDIAKCEDLSFESPDFDKFPCLKYAYQAAKIRGTMPAVLNAVNEIAVDAFLRNKIGFMDIPALVRSAMDAHSLVRNPNIHEIMEADAWARRFASEKLFAGKGR